MINYRQKKVIASEKSAQFPHHVYALVKYVHNFDF